MFFLNKTCIVGCTVIATTILTELCTTSSVSAYSLNWGRSGLTWTGGDLTNTYEFDPLYTSEVEPLYVKFTVSSDPAGEEVNNRGGIKPTPGIFLGTQPQGGAGLFTDELFVMTNRATPTYTITLDIEFFKDEDATMPTDVEDFNVTFADIDGGNRQESLEITGIDASSSSINPTFTKLPSSGVTFSGNIINGVTSGVTDDSANVNVNFDGFVHNVTVDFVATGNGGSIRHMYMTDLGITPTDIPITPVPFEFSPTIGILMSLGLLGGHYLQKKYL